MAESRVPGPRSANVPCRYYAIGRCAAGVSCAFLHQSGATASSDKNSSKSETQKRVCMYFQQGTCKYGSSCMFKHQISSSSTNSSDSFDLSISPTLHNSTVSTKSKESTTPLSSHSQNSSTPKPVLRHPSNMNATASSLSSKKTGAKSKRDVSIDSSQASTSISSSDCDSDTSKENLSPTDEGSSCISASQLNLDAPEFVPSYLSSSYNIENKSNSEASATGGAKSWAQIVSPNGSSAVKPEPVVGLDPSGLPLLCPYAEMGDCPYGDTCQYLHGDICEFCGLPCLHPFSEERSKQHTTECIKQHEIDMEHSMAVARSRDKVCGVCFEVIMDKNPIREQRFGILPNCNHCFCLACIRKWRQAKQFESKIIRACPECRVTSDFVCPSAYWVDTKEDKEKLLTEYRQALSVKQCKYFEQGKGKCPFGNKCFYLHALSDGTKVDLGPPVKRKLKDANGDIIIVDEHLLWDFVLDREDGRWWEDFDDEMLEDLFLDAYTLGLD